MAENNPKSKQSRDEADSLANLPRRLDGKDDEEEEQCRCDDDDDDDDGIKIEKHDIVTRRMDPSSSRQGRRPVGGGSCSPAVVLFHADGGSCDKKKGKKDDQLAVEGGAGRMRGVKRHTNNYYDDKHNPIHAHPHYYDAISSSSFYPSDMTRRLQHYTKEEQEITTTTNNNNNNNNNQTIIVPEHTTAATNATVSPYYSPNSNSIIVSPEEEEEPPPPTPSLPSLSRNQAYHRRGGGGGTPPQVPGAYPQRGIGWNPDSSGDLANETREVVSGGNNPIILNELGEPEAIALAVTLDDLEREVQNQIIANAPRADIVEEGRDNNEDSAAAAAAKKTHRAVRVFIVLVVLSLCFALMAIIVPIVLQQLRGGNERPQQQQQQEEAKTAGTETAATKDDNGNSFVYVVSMDMVNFCGHENFRAKRCGGHLASITTLQEKRIVDQLKDLALHKATSQNLTSWGGPLEGVWIGGEQVKGSRNDTGSHEEDIVWWWTDGSPWFDGDNTNNDDSDSDATTQPKYGNYWSSGEPDNALGKINNRTKGEHHVILTASGKYKDDNGCSGHLAPKGPGIYILPNDYMDHERFPDCQRGPLLEDSAVAVPARPHPEWLYVLSQNYHPICTSNAKKEELFNECGGYYASITNIREKAIVDMLKDVALKAAKDDGKIDVDGVWIGATQPLEGRNDTGQEEVNASWQWIDGSTWFDHDGAYWAHGQPDNAIHNTNRGGDPNAPLLRTRGEHAIMLNADGQYQDELDCSVNGVSTALSKKLPSIYILPFDYANRSKYLDCRSGAFTKMVPVPPRP